MFMLYFRLVVQKKTNLQLYSQIFKTIFCSYCCSLVFISISVLLPLHRIHFIINNFSGSLAASVKYLQVYELINVPVRQTNSPSIL